MIEKDVYIEKGYVLVGVGCDLYLVIFEAVDER